MANPPSKDESALYSDDAVFPDVRHHDVPERHRFGDAFLIPTVVRADTAAGSTGSAEMPARADHSHPIKSGGLQQAYFLQSAVANDSTNSGQFNLTFNFPAAVPLAGWAEIVANAYLGFSAANITGINHLLFTNSYSQPGPAVAQQLYPTNPNVAISAGLWSPMPSTELIMGPIVAGTTPQFTWRMNWVPNGNAIWYSVNFSVKVYAT